MSIIDRITGGRVAKAVVNPRGLSDLEALRREVDGKVVLVTGASFGLGEATAVQLGRAGATVLVVARTADKLQAVADQITAAGGTAHAYATDLTDVTAVDELVAKVLSTHGHVDVLVNNAGKSMRRSVHLQYDRPHDFTRTMDINYTGPVRLIMGLLPSMRERKSGTIVNVSTIGVRIPPGPRWGVYQSTKGAFDIWLRSIAPEIAVDNVKVSTIYMALIYTRMSAPTPSMQRLPGLRPDEAAELVFKAIVKTPREISPWWVWPAEVGSALSRGSAIRISAMVTGASDDSDAARGAAAAPADHARNKPSR